MAHTRGTNMNVDYVRRTCDRVMATLGCAHVSGLRDCQEKPVRDLTGLFPKSTCHHFLDLVINGNKVCAVVDTGSNSSILSRGACNALGLKP